MMRRTRHSKDLSLSKIFHHRQWRRLARRGLRVGRRHHQIHELGLALIEEGLELAALGIAVDTVELDSIRSRRRKRLAGGGLACRVSERRIQKGARGKGRRGGGLLTFESILYLGAAVGFGFLSW